MVRGRRSRGPLRRTVDLFITLFLAAAIIYLAWDMLRSGRFTFLRFSPLSLSLKGCDLSPPPPEVVRAWEILVRNSKVLSSSKIKVLQRGSPLLEIRVKGKDRELELAFFREGRRVAFTASDGGREKVFEVGDWTFRKLLEALGKYCGEEKGDGG